jgi:hypothetical protein
LADYLLMVWISSHAALWGKYGEKKPRLEYII